MLNKLSSYLPSPHAALRTTHTTMRLGGQVAEAGLALYENRADLKSWNRTAYTAALIAVAVLDVVDHFEALRNTTAIKYGRLALYAARFAVIGSAYFVRKHDLPKFEAGLNAMRMGQVGLAFANAKQVAAPATLAFAFNTLSVAQIGTRAYMWVRSFV